MELPMCIYLWVRYTVTIYNLNRLLIYDLLANFCEKDVFGGWN